MRRLLPLLFVFLCATPLFAQQPVQPLPQTGSPADGESNTCAQCARIGVYLSFFNGTTWDRARGDTTNGLWVNVKNSVAQTISGSVAVTGTFWQATQPVSIADGSSVTLGAKADARSTATDSTAVTIMQVLKEISFMEQTPASRAVTNAGTFAVQATQTTNPWIVAGAGTAGSAATGVVTVQGIASMTKLLVTPDSVALPANQSVNVNQWNGGALASPDANSYPITAKAATATTTAGTSTCYITSAASTNSTNCKASAGNLYEIHVTNTTTTNYFLRLYNASSAPTCSSSTGFVETVPALGASANGGINGRLMDPPQAFSTGIGFCLTGGGSSTDNTNAATGVYVTLLYK